VEELVRQGNKEGEVLGGRVARDAVLVEAEVHLGFAEEDLDLPAQGIEAHQVARRGFDQVADEELDRRSRFVGQAAEDDCLGASAAEGESAMASQMPATVRS
jgi:hypothetical protein